MHDEVCSDPILWMQVNMTTCPCLKKAGPHYLRCGMRKEQMKRPVSMCRWTAKMLELAGMEEHA